jgi:uncharacterized RDD family membrane protein YckC
MGHDEVDVGDLSPAARERVAFLLRNEGVDYDAAHQIIRFPAELRLAVLGAVEEAAAFSIVARGVEQRRSRHDAVVVLVVASRTRRVVAGWLDGFIIALVSYVLLQSLGALDPSVAGWLAFVVAEWVVVVIPMALTGRPPGARAVGTIVITMDNDRVPGWSKSALRWLVAHLPVFIGAVVVAVGAPDGVDGILWVLQLAGLVAIYAGVFFDAQGQGLHDRAAGTVVVDEAGHVAS